MDIETYISEMEANGRSKYTIKATRQVLSKLNNFKRLDKITKDDLVKYFKNFQGTDEVKRLYQGKIKKFYNDNEKSELVDWIELIKPKETLTADDILTPDDINNLLEATDGVYWKALIAFLYESGCRISEARALKFKDFKETNDGLIVDIPTTKTASGFRRIILILSAEYIRNLKVYTSLPADNEIFYMSETHMEQTLKKIAKKAGITKPVTPQKFRHAQATILVQQGRQEAIIRKKLGWSSTSTMIARYQHLNDNAVVEAELGKKIDFKPIDIKQPEKVSIVDTAVQVSKIIEENESLKEELHLQNIQHQVDIEEMRHEMEKLKKETIDLYKNMKAGITPSDFTKKKL